MSDEAQRAEEDREANYFAMCLLMPESLLRKDLEGVALDVCDDASIAKLARRYVVSIQLMTMRLTQLGYFGKLR